MMHIKETEATSFEKLLFRFLNVKKWTEIDERNLARLQEEDVVSFQNFLQRSVDHYATLIREGAEYNYPAPQTWQFLCESDAIDLVRAEKAQRDMGLAS